VIDDVGIKQEVGIKKETEAFLDLILNLPTATDKA
jgi:hypothetical protein